MTKKMGPIVIYNHVNTIGRLTEFVHPNHKRLKLKFEISLLGDY